ncbi:MAG TPA: DUF4390 domain-containing protein [Candidatus Desulfobacillus sp.]|nr:DUF4390 domain-containing protein [Candidatus Desulfobacillus sp.]
MTASFTPSCKSAPSRLLPQRSARRLAATLLACVLLLCPCFASAAEIDVKSAEIRAGDEAWLLDAEFGIDLGQRLQEVIAHGVALYFIAECELTSTRWYWIDEHVAGRKQTWRLAFNALTRQYRLSSGALFQSFDTLEEALGVLSRLRDWKVADKGQLKPGETYHAALRLKLDLTQLPKPFQVSALGSRDWNISAEIRRWSFVAARGVEK